MAQNKVMVRFPESSTAEANVFANSLRGAIRDADPGVEVELARDRPDTQDFGATIAIILGSASATAVASGIAKWLARHSGVRIDMTTAAGSVLAENLDSADAARIVQALAGSS